MTKETGCERGCELWEDGLWIICFPEINNLPSLTRSFGCCSPSIVVVAVVALLVAPTLPASQLLSSRADFCYRSCPDRRTTGAYSNSKQAVRRRTKVNSTPNDRSLTRRPKYLHRRPSVTLRRSKTRLFSFFTKKVSPASSLPYSPYSPSSLPTLS